MRLAKLGPYTAATRTMTSAISRHWWMMNSLSSLQLRSGRSWRRRANQLRLECGLRCSRPILRLHLDNSFALRCVLGTLRASTDSILTSQLNPASSQAQPLSGYSRIRVRIGHNIHPYALSLRSRFREIAVFLRIQIGARPDFALHARHPARPPVCGFASKGLRSFESLDELYFHAKPPYSLAGSK